MDDRSLYSVDFDLEPAEIETFFESDSPVFSLPAVRVREETFDLNTLPEGPLYPDSLTSSEAYKLWLEQRKWDPYHPLNRTVLHPETDASLFTRLLPVQQQWIREHYPEVGFIWVAISPYRLATVTTGARWYPLFSSGKRYMRRDVYLAKRERTTEYLHTFIMRCMLRENATLRLEKCKEFSISASIPVEVQIDALMAKGYVNHINHLSDDNRDENLELVQPIDNCRQSAGKANTSGFTGVSWHSLREKWIAYVEVRQPHGRSTRKHVGYFDRQQPDVAALARALYSLSRPGVMPSSRAFSPPRHDRKVWENVLIFLETGYAPDFGWTLSSLSLDMARWYKQACRRHQKKPLVLAPT